MPLMNSAARRVAAPKDALDRMVDRLRLTFSTDAGALAQPSGDGLEIVAHAGLALNDLRRAEALFATAALSSETLIIPDIEADRRFAGVVSGIARFFAAAPFEGVDGRTGILAVFDGRPRRDFEHADAALLRAFAQRASVLLPPDATTPSAA